MNHDKNDNIPLKSCCLCVIIITAAESVACSVLSKIAKKYGVPTVNAFRHTGYVCEKINFIERGSLLWQVNQRELLHWF